MFHVKAPYYLIISGKGKLGEEEHPGFIGQQFVLWLNARELGAVWFGGSRDASESRKPSDAVEDKGVKAIHIAPSGMNLQPWYTNLQEWIWE